MYFRFDQLGKNILRDFFVLVGAAETEMEVPASDAQRIDVWHEPDPELLRAHPEIEPGLLRSMAAEAGMVEVFSAGLGAREFNDCMRKRYLWHHTLERRAERPLALTSVWLVSAGRPDTVLRDFGFAEAAAGPAGFYAGPAQGWRVQIVVAAELPRVRSTVLLRLLGSARVRREARRELAALPEDAWERRVALPWLVRLSFEVPADLLREVQTEEKDFIMETREWYEQTLKQAAEKAAEKAAKQGEERGEERGRLQMTARLCAIRLGRPLTDTEQAALASQLDQLGDQRVGEMLLSSSADTLAALLADPSAR